jgi:8-oxo-dGTP diphosphatase / 2-hydroxy-dATP diphosphatase
MNQPRSAVEKLLTLAIVTEGDRILLGYKKRGFGAGRWNGFGGKVQRGERVEEAARRELWEEARIRPLGIRQHGTLDFSFAYDPVPLRVHVFRVTSFSGEASETEEMKPQWFPVTRIPYDTMWADDRYWLPLLLEGKAFRGTFTFRDYDTLESHDVQVLSPAALRKE